MTDQQGSQQDSPQDNPTETDPELVKLLNDLKGEGEVIKPELVPDSPPVQPEVVIQGDDIDKIQKIINDFEGIRDEIITNYRSDRNQVEKAIKEFEQRMSEGTTKVVVESYVNALRIKADINANAIKMLDATAKLLSAGKSTNIVQAQGIGPQDLEKILSTPAYPDEKL